jgi:hypothetical protein
MEEVELTIPSLLPTCPKSTHFGPTPSLPQISSALSLFTTYILEVWSSSALVRTLLLDWLGLVLEVGWPLLHYSVADSCGESFFFAGNCPDTDSWCLDNQFWVLKCAQHIYNLVSFGEYLDITSLVRSRGKWGLNPVLEIFLMRTSMWQLSYVCGRFYDTLASLNIYIVSLYILRRGSW